MQTAARLGSILTVVIFCSTAIAQEPWEKGSCRKKDMNFAVVDFHAHTFNFRHLPLQGILYGWGVPEFVSDAAADLLWGMTGELGATVPDEFSALQYEPDDEAFSVDFRTRATSFDMDYYQAASESLPKEERARFEQELNQYLAAEIELELEQQTAIGVDIDTPISDYFRSLTPFYPDIDEAQLAPPDPSDDQIVNALAQMNLLDKIVALLIKPFGLISEIQGAYRFLAAMVQAEDKVAEKLLDDNCRVDYFVHHMMDLEPVYDDRPPLRFIDQYEVVGDVRQLTGDRIISFSAFTPFRFGDSDLNFVKAAVESGVVGVKYYPPSGYGATVDFIPKKPPRFRGIIYQGGPRKQWQRRYSSLDDADVQQSWGVTITDPDREREDTLEGISDRFFDYAADHDLVVFAHQSPGGFEAGKGYGGKFAEPCSWLPVLEEHPDFRLVLGHSGGDAWYASDTRFADSFSRQAFNMCVTFENVYCDFGYHEDILEDAGKSALGDRLLALHNTALSPTAATLTAEACRTTQAPMKYSIFDKIMYGSDWMMVIRERDFNKLVDAFDEVFVGDLAQYRSKFFGGNALAILNKAGTVDRLPDPIKK